MKAPDHGQRPPNSLPTVDIGSGDSSHTGEAPRQNIATVLHDLLADHRDLDDFLDSLVRVSAEHIGGERGIVCGVILRRAKTTTVVASSSAEAYALDEVQSGFDDGPCLEAQRTGMVVRVPDARFEQRWPEYMDIVREHGWRSALAVPLNVGETASAAINFYSHQPRLFDDRVVAKAREYADMVGKIVRATVRITDLSDEARDRQAAMESRTAIDLAVGVIMAQNRCSQDEAFEILRRASSNQNIKLRVLAERIIASIGQGPAETAFDA